MAASAIRHNHFLVAVSAGLVLLGLALQSLAAALFVVRSVYGDGPGTVFWITVGGIIPYYISRFGSDQLANGWPCEDVFRFYIILCRTFLPCFLVGITHLCRSKAAGATGAGVLYNVSTPQFVNGEWVIAAMSLPDTKTISNGTLSATTIGIHSLGNCQSPDTVLRILPFIVRDHFLKN